MHLPNDDVTIEDYPSNIEGTQEIAAITGSLYPGKLTAHDSGICVNQTVRLEKLDLSTLHDMRKLHKKAPRRPQPAPMSARGSQEAQRVFYTVLFFATLIWSSAALVAFF